jgi:hypothetical protein
LKLSKSEKQYLKWALILGGGYLAYKFLTNGSEEKQLPKVEASKEEEVKELRKDLEDKLQNDVQGQTVIQPQGDDKQAIKDDLTWLADHIGSDITGFAAMGIRALGVVGKIQNAIPMVDNLNADQAAVGRSKLDAYRAAHPKVDVSSLQALVADLKATPELEGIGIG